MRVVAAMVSILLGYGLMVVALGASIQVFAAPGTFEVYFGQLFMCIGAWLLGYAVCLVETERIQK